MIMEAKPHEETPTQYANIMEAKPTQYAVIMEAHDQVVSEVEAHRTGDCTGPFSQAPDDLRRDWPTSR